MYTPIKQLTHSPMYFNQRRIPSKNPFVASIVTLAMVSALTISADVLQHRETVKALDSSVQEPETSSTSGTSLAVVPPSGSAPATATTPISTSTSTPAPTSTSTPSSSPTSSSPSPTPTPTPTPAPSPTPSPTPTPAPTPTPTPTPPPPAPTYTYKNGTYAAVGTYQVPGNYTEDLGVQLTVYDDNVTAATVTNEADNSTSSWYQDSFIANYKSYVVGKPLATLNVPKIAGGTLTPYGFNDAASQIRNLAQ